MQKENHVVVIDDDPSVRKGLGNLMRAAGYDVRIFASAKEFLDVLSPDICGCLILDARMPGMSGEELLRELNTSGIELCVIVITADDSPEIKRMADKMKAVGFFRKPVDGTALLDAVEWGLRSKFASRNNKLNTE